MRFISLALNVSKHSITATLSFAGSDDEMLMLSARSMVVLMGNGLLIIASLFIRHKIFVASLFIHYFWLLHKLLLYLHINFCCGRVSSQLEYMNHRDKNKPYGGILYTGDTAFFILYSDSIFLCDPRQHASISMVLLLFDHLSPVFCILSRQHQYPLYGILYP